MKRVIFAAGLAAGFYISRKTAKFAIQRELEILRKRNEELQMWSQLIVWLDAAPWKGFSPTEIEDYYKMQVKYIHQVRKP